MMRKTSHLPHRFTIISRVNLASWLGQLLRLASQHGIRTIVIALLFASSSLAGLAAQKAQPRVKLGCEVFLENPLPLVRGKKLGLITNPTGVDSRCRSIADLFFQRSDFKLVALYGPEHGVRGNAQAGELVPFYRDDQYHLPVFSLYGQFMKPASGMLQDMDAYMRSFDTQLTGKVLESNMASSVEVMVFDIQDVGTRIYTYIATMAYAMQACAELGIPFVVLDRPNPINGRDLEGPILEYPQFSSFVGLYPIPVRHGMTVGELAIFFNKHCLPKAVQLAVVPMSGWRRDQWHDETRLPWVMPSPNMPTLATATVYPGQVFLEGTTLSEGRGTTRPFELFGAPWLDGYTLSRKLNQLGLAGVYFREAWFTPSFSKYQGQLCGGCQIHVLDRTAYHPFSTALHILKTVRELAPNQLQFHTDYFDKIMGTRRIRLALEQNTPVEDILRSLQSDLKDFSKRRKTCLLY